MTVSHQITVQPNHEGCHTVTPWTISRDTAGLFEFVNAAFGAKEIARVVGVDGSIGHAEDRIGDSVVMMSDAKPRWPDTPAFLRLYVIDGDAAFKQALKSGAAAVTEMTHMFWGDRVGRVRDPFGNLWWIQTRIEDVRLEEMERRTTEKEGIDAVNDVQSAQCFPSTSNNAK